MATGREIELHYDTLGSLHALRMEDVQGGFPDYTCAFYNGNYSKSYPQAQLDKHAWIFDGLGLGQDLKGKRILDIGCGWGPMLHAATERGAEAIGLTLSPGQVAYCKERGLDARLQDYKTLKPSELGVFDGIVSLGAFEHFCSIDEQEAGKQEEVYRNFFKICADRLKPGGKLYLQTMTWGKEVPDYKKLSLSAPEGTPERILARMEYLYPGSWLPNGLDQIVACASEYFDFVSHNNGRLDYLETLKAWHASTPNLWKPHMLLKSLRKGIPVLFNILTKRSAWIQWQSASIYGDQSEVFRREIFSHERMFFVKKG